MFKMPFDNNCIEQCVRLKKKTDTIIDIIKINNTNYIINHVWL